MEIESRIKDKLKEIFKEEYDLLLNDNEIILQTSDNRDFGDVSSNIALRKAKQLNLKPLELAERIVKLFTLDGVKKVEAAGAGFLNFFYLTSSLSRVIVKIINEKENYGNLTIGKDKKVNIEYVSANPTGTLHLGHARGAAIGDSLSRIYKKAGFIVTREYYINDAGSQIDNLGKSLMVRYLELFNISIPFPEDGYHGDDIKKVALILKEQIGDRYVLNYEKHLENFKEFASVFLLEKIKEDLKEFNVVQDVYTSEKSIREKGGVEKVLERLKPYTYSKDGALFLNTTKDGDDKDRVLVKKDGLYTYLLPDIAYHSDKFSRGYDLIIDLFGADHHGYVSRMKSSMLSLGYDASKLNILLVQMVRLFKDGKEFKMSKRTGNAVSMKELIEEVGVDAARYFFVSRNSTSHLDFDVTLAKTLGKENPVYYCQYTHARLVSILTNGKKFYPLSYTADLLNDEKERNLILFLKAYGENVNMAVNDNEPYRITSYVYQLATLINEFYAKCHVLDEKNTAKTKERLGLVEACEIVLKDALTLIGVTAPDVMISLNEKEK